MPGGKELADILEQIARNQSSQHDNADSDEARKTREAELLDQAAREFDRSSKERIQEFLRSIGLISTLDQVNERVLRSRGKVTPTHYNYSYSTTETAYYAGGVLGRPTFGRESRYTARKEIFLSGVFLKTNTLPVENGRRLSRAPYVFIGFKGKQARIGRIEVPSFDTFTASVGFSDESPQEPGYFSIDPGPIGDGLWSDQVHLREFLQPLKGEDSASHTTGYFSDFTKLFENPDFRKRALGATETRLKNFFGTYSFPSSA